MKDKEVRHACEEDKTYYLEGPPPSRLQTLLHTSWHSLQVHQRTENPFTWRCSTIIYAQDRPIDDTDEIRERWRGYTESVYMKDQTVQAEWLAIPSIVVYPVLAVLPAEV